MKEAAVYVRGRRIELDESGHLLNLGDWNEEVAERLAEEEGVELIEEHWEIINFVRGYYQEFKFSPSYKVLIKGLAQKFGHDRYDGAYLYGLFPDGPARQSSRIAGLPKPCGCCG